MATKYRRMTFMLTPDIERMMNDAKKRFYDKSQSEIVRMLIVLGLQVLEEEQEKNKQETA